MLTYAGLINQFAFTHVAAHTLFKINLLHPYRARWASILADLAHLTLRHPLNSPEGSKAKHAERRAKWASIAAIEARHENTANHKEQQNRPKEKRLALVEKRAERLEILKYRELREVDRRDKYSSENDVFKPKCAIVKPLRQSATPALRDDPFEDVLQSTERTQ